MRAVRRAHPRYTLPRQHGAGNTGNYSRGYHSESPRRFVETPAPLTHSTSGYCAIAPAPVKQIDGTTARGSRLPRTDPAWSRKGERSEHRPPSPILPIHLAVPACWPLGRRPRTPVCGCPGTLFPTRADIPAASRSRRPASSGAARAPCARGSTIEPGGARASLAADRRRVRAEQQPSPTLKAALDDAVSGASRAAEPSWSV
jgi:hypothetical protein